MTTLKQIIVVSTLTLFGAVAQTAFAQLPNCQSASSDTDGDGFGWENNQSCRVSSSTGSTSSSLGVCADAASDPDGDGFGWENGASCRVAASDENTTGSTSSSLPSCASAASDPDGDGFGWEDGASCRVGASAGNATGSTSSSLPACTSSASDSDGDGFGWENGASCVADRTDVGSSTSNGIINDDDPPTTTQGGEFTSDATGTDVIRVSSLPLTAARSITVNSDGGDQFRTEQVGDFQLMQNAWRAWRAAPGYEWTQTIYTNNGSGAPVGWSYDWGPGVPGVNGLASDDFYVRSYPELIYGIKDEFRTSATKAQIGFPVRVDAMPAISIDYAYDAPLSGPSRPVTASVNTSRYPNNTSQIQGERNVAVESFMYESVGGVCDDTLPVTRTGGSNHVYEVMVWLDSGAERLPAAQSGYVTTVSIRGADYDVYTKSSDNRYIAFVARNPQTTGTIYWNDFIDWARINAHQVQQEFGARSNSVQIQDSWCVANIIVGTEIFWGAGNFDLLNWTITQSQ